MGIVSRIDAAARPYKKKKTTWLATQGCGFESYLLNHWFHNDYRLDNVQCINIGWDRLAELPA